MFLKNLTGTRLSIFNEKDKINSEDLVKLSKAYLKNCTPIPNMKKEISDSQLKLLVELLDNNGNFYYNKTIGDGFLQFDEIDGILKRRSMLNEGKKDVKILLILKIIFHFISLLRKHNL